MYGVISSGCQHAEWSTMQYRVFFKHNKLSLMRDKCSHLTSCLLLILQTCNNRILCLRKLNNTHFYYDIDVYLNGVGIKFLSMLINFVKVILSSFYKK